MNHCGGFPLRPREDDIDKVLQHTKPKWVNKKHKRLTSSHFESHLWRGDDCDFLEVIMRHVGIDEARALKGKLIPSTLRVSTRCMEAYNVPNTFHQKQGANRTGKGISTLYNPIIRKAFLHQVFQVVSLRKLPFFTLMKRRQCLSKHFTIYRNPPDHVRQIPFIHPSLLTSYAEVSFCVYSKEFKLFHLYGINSVSCCGVCHLRMRSFRSI